MKNDRFRKDADLLLGGLTWTQADENRVMSELKGERPKMKRKMRLGLVLAMGLVLVAAAALAAGLVFSPRYDAVRLANEALESQYGITPAMMTVFYRADTVSDADGNDVIIYGSVEPQWAEQLGVYTVTVQGHTAQAVWSHDGEPISEGLSSPVWGAEQISLILSDYAAAFAFVESDAEPIPLPSQEEIAANTQKRQQNAAMAKERARITMEEARALGREAIAQVYGLTAAQCEALETMEDEDFACYDMENGEPVISICYFLMQSEDGEYTEGDGQYWVTVHAETGVIENVLYDSGLAGNG